MLNMIDTQDKLKNFSEEQLVKEMQQPTGSAPQFMVLGEIERRKRMRADAKRQEGLMQPTVAQEAVSAAGVPQQGIAQVAQSLAPKTDMTQNTGVPNVQATQLPGQPNQPQRMADGGIMRLAPGGGISGGTISAIARLKVLAPKIYEQYKDDPEMLALAAEYVNTPSNDLEKTGLESIEAPYVDPYGPQGLAQRTAGAEVGNQARMASAAAQQREVDRMLGINAPIGSGRQGAPLDAEARRRIAEEDMAMAVPVPRNDFRTFPGPNVQTSAGALSVPELAPFLFSGDTGVSRDGRTDEKILADAQALIAARKTPESDAILAEITRPRNYSAAAAAAEAKVENQAAMSDRAEAVAAGLIALENAAEQPRMSELELESRLAEVRTAPDVTDTRFDSVPTPGVRPSETPRLSELNGNPSSVSELYVPDLNPIAAAAETATAPEYTMGDYGLLPVGSVPTPEEKIEAEVASLNAQIAAAGDDEVLIGLLTRRKNGLVKQLQIAEAQTDTGEFLSDIPATVDRAFQEYIAPGLGLTTPEQAAARINAIDADIGDTIAAERAREAKIAGLAGGATTVSAPEGLASINDAARMKEINEIPEPGSATVSPVVTKEIEALQKRKVEAIKTITDPTAMPVGGTGSGGTGSGGTGSGGTNKKGGISAAKSKMDQDKWLALAQAGFTLMSTGDFGKAGSAGLAALQGYKKADREDRKLDAELLLREAQLAAANRKDSGSALTANQLLSRGNDLIKSGQTMLENAGDNADAAEEARKLIMAGKELIRRVTGGVASSGSTGAIKLPSAG